MAVAIGLLARPRPALATAVLAGLLVLAADAIAWSRIDAWSARHTPNLREVQGGLGVIIPLLLWVLVVGLRLLAVAVAVLGALVVLAALLAIPATTLVGRWWLARHRPPPAPEDGGPEDGPGTGWLRGLFAAGPDDGPDPDPDPDPDR
jgi:hypothetical protein